jgi:ThiF family
VLAYSSCFQFRLSLKCLHFDIAAMAGNIIPAIATTNAIIAGLIVMECLKILDGQISKCSSVSIHCLNFLTLPFSSSYMY